MKIGIRLFQIGLPVFLMSLVFSSNVLALTQTETECPSGSAICKEKHGDTSFCQNGICVLPNIVSYESVWYNLDKPAYEEKVYHDSGVGWEKTNNSAFTNLLNAGGVAVTGVSSETAARMVANGQTPPTGALASIGSGIGFMVSKPPTNTHEYLADLGRSAGFVKEAYAQGTGWSTLQPVLNLWKVFRNLAYLVFVVVFVVIGFMIMLRSKIGGQTVVTVQAALPNIIVTLLLITFSYAIASFMIDLIYLSIYIVVGLFENGKIIETGTGSLTRDKLMNTNIIKLGWQSIWGFKPGTDTVRGAADAVGEVVSDVLQSKFIGNIIAGSLAYLIFAVALLIATFKTFFQILMAYIGIILNVIFGPIILLSNAMPGSKSFSNWIKGLLANVLIFPVVAIMFILAAALTGSGDNELGVLGSIAGSFQSTTILPFIGGTNASALGGLIGFGMLMIMPKITEMIQKMLKVESPLAGMAGAAMEPISQGWKLGPQRAYNKFAERKAEADKIENDALLHAERDPNTLQLIKRYPSNYKNKTLHTLGQGAKDVLKFWK